MSGFYTHIRYFWSQARWILGLFLLVVVGAANPALAQFPITQTFTTGTASGWVLGGNTRLTSGNPDPAGAGYLHLTSNAGSQTGYAYYDTAFPTSLGMSIDFEYLSWGGSGADDISMFLFDGSTTNFKIGDFGGGLGYCQGYSNSLVGGSPTAISATAARTVPKERLTLGPMPS